MNGLNYLSSLAKWRGSGIFSLDNVRAVCHDLGNPQDLITSIHVAGTNGKGSVSAAVSSILGCAGKKVLMTSSPHLVSVNERILIDGYPISDIELSENVLQVKDSVTRLGLELSHFEAITIAAFLSAAKNKVDYMVVEVGLGGRLDATNIIKSPAVSAIVSIGLDHENVLGNTAALIAREKAGIIKDNGNVVVGDLSSESLDVIIEISKSHNATIYRAQNEFKAEALPNNVIEYWDKSGAKFQFTSSLKGEFQANNMGVAVKICSILGIDYISCIEGIQNVRWPARMMSLYQGSDRIIIDSAHNIPGIQALTYYLSNNNLSGIPIVFGALNTKRWQDMIELLAPHVTEWYPVKIESSEAVPVDDIVTCLSGLGINSNDIYTGLGLIDTIDFALNNSESGNILICGSMYLAGSVLRDLKVSLPPVWRRQNKKNLERN